MYHPFLGRTLVCATETHGVHTHRVEVGLLLEEINRIDSRIASEPGLVAQRALLLRKLNLIQPAIARLPYEMISNIFKLLTPSPIDACTLSIASRSQRAPLSAYYVPLLLSAVSMQWREIAYSTPSIWTSVHWTSSLKERFPPWLLLIYIRNSGNLPLHLSLSLRPSGKSKHLVDPIIDAELIQNMPRIRALELGGPPTSWDTYFHKLTSVVDLALDFEGDDFRHNISLDRCTTLRHVYLQSQTANSRFRLPWNLTHLDVSLQSIDRALKILCRCPNIVELYFGYSESPSDDDPGIDLWFEGPIFFNHLEVFTWSIPDTAETWEWAHAFMDVARMPVLRKLSLLMEDHHHDASSYALTTIEYRFFERVSRTVSTLALNILAAGSIFPCFFSSDSALENLTISDSAIAVVADLAAALMPKDSGAGKQAPRLKMLKLTGVFMEIEGEEPRISVKYILDIQPFHLQKLVTALERRLAGRDEFCIEFSRLSPQWTYSFQNRLRKMVKNGVKLDIVEDGNHVDWLHAV
ncbi:hypothetical protein NP233_g7774 [Leucocoprinus birnbaumii]|uniref:F-box domain-containing protein n=1 Tax=Leucocoprinus birnbaumii TaxID=56174 RepID=A0AAD5VNI4_9AGAR|nr:hypothetical protein NP233_g7774 [Leucocoprinus birnbaumii]